MKNAMKRVIYVFLFLLFGIVAQAQVNQEVQSKSNLASTYYSSRQYGKAAALYLELFETTNLNNYFDMYINSLIGNKDYEEAEKVLKKQLRRDKNPNYFITLGFVYSELKQPDKAKEQYDDALKNLQRNVPNVISTANAFLNRREFEYAEKTYLKGRELVQGEMFRYYLSSVYSYQRNYSSMITELLLMVKEDEKELPKVTSRVKSLLMYDSEESLLDMFKCMVIKQIQLEPEILAYNRLLIWVFVEEQNYTNALRQAMALDRRTRTEDKSILDFATDAVRQNQFDIAAEALGYLKTRKPESQLLPQIDQQHARTLYLKYTNTANRQAAFAAEINSTFEKLFADQGFVLQTIPLVIDYAHFLAFYQNDILKAITLLTNAMNAKGINALQQAQLKIELSDIHVYNNNLWEATLLYAQIADAHGNNPIGDEAKLKKAKLSYYMGDIYWAQAQVDILKASTSKLTANDAMELAMLITSHFNLDTIAEPLQMFARADLLIYQNKDSLALQTFDTLTTVYPTHTLFDKILMRKASIHEKYFRFEEAANYYEQILKNYNYSTSADDACFYLARMNEFQFKNTERAQELYKTILTDYPGSIFVHESRTRYRYLRGDIQESEIRNMLP
jgi:hypothetical protein